LSATNTHHLVRILIVGALVWVGGGRGRWGFGGGEKLKGIKEKNNDDFVPSPTSREGENIHHQPTRQEGDYETTCLPLEKRMYGRKKKKATTTPPS